jgi:TrkA domain protein
MTVYETDVPGVGRKFEVDVGDGARIVVVIHHSGRRELFFRPTEGADSERVATLTGEEARQVGAVLEGAYFQPLELDSQAVPLGDAIIEWVEIDEDSPLSGQTLGDADVRHRCGVSILAIQRGEETIENPTSDVEIRADDVLVALGTREEQAAFRELHTGQADG